MQFRLKKENPINTRRLDAIFEGNSSSDKGESFCNNANDEENDFDEDGEEVLRTFVSDSETCFKESILHRDLELQSNIKSDCDDINDVGDNNNQLNNSDSQPLPPTKQGRASTAAKGGMHCSATK